MNGLHDRRGEKSCRKRAGADDELLLLRARQLIGRRVEHDERQDVRFVERRRARQVQLGLLQRTDDADARLNAGDVARHADIELGIQIAAEDDRARWNDVEAASLKRVRSGERVQGACHIQRLSGILIQIQVAEHAQRHFAQANRRPRRDLHVRT